MNIQAFVTTAPRRTNYLAATLESLRIAGWPDPFIAAEPGIEVPAHARLVRNNKRLGPWKTTLKGMSFALCAGKDIDAVMLVQDDVIIAQGLRFWLAKNCADMLDSTLGVASLYTPGIHAHRGVGWWALPIDDMPRKCYGACALIIPRQSALRLLTDIESEAVPYTSDCKVDLQLGQHCRRWNLDWRYHSPSFAQHIGAASAIDPEGANGRPDKYRAASECVLDVRRYKPPVWQEAAE